MEKKSIIKIIKDVVKLLYERKFDFLYSEDLNKRITADEIRIAIDEYGGQLTLPEVQEYELMDIYGNLDSGHVSVDFDLWFDGEKSDLTLKCGVYEINDGVYAFAIHNIRVL